MKKLNMRQVLTILATMLLLSVAPFAVKAATYTVTTTADTGAGSLRTAVGTANSTTADDVINFNLPPFTQPGGCSIEGICTITLAGEIAIGNSDQTTGKLTITNSTGATNLVISGGSSNRAFLVAPGADLTLNGLTVMGGNGTGATGPAFNGFGGGIYSAGKLTITNSIIKDNAAQNSGGGVYSRFDSLNITNTTVSGNSAVLFAGGILAGGILNLTNSTVSNNTADFGGGIASNNTLTIINSTVSDNTAQDNGGGIRNEGGATITGSTINSNKAGTVGGGILNFGGTLALTTSTVSGNSALSNNGGGIYSDNALTVTNSTLNANTAQQFGGAIITLGTLNLTNSTISGNSASSNGGIISEGTSNLVNVTITDNRATSTSCTNCGGGFINNSGAANLLNTIVAGNTVGNGASAPDFKGAVTMSSYSIFGSGQGAAGITDGVNHNQVGTNTALIDARLSPLGNYGGATQTHALIFDSPAINNGTATGAPTTDQRGVNRSGATDIGAFEFVPYIVTNTLDSGAGSLRQAIINANTTSLDDSINFNIAGCPNNICTITLTSGEISVSSAATAGRLMISNFGVNQLRISGNNTSRVFLVASGADLTLDGVTVTDGNSTNSFGAIGGGIFNAGGAVQLINSTLSGNFSPQVGGGIFNDGTLTLINSTLSGNAAGGGGGGIFNGGTATLTNATVSNNGSPQGGGILNADGRTVNLLNTLIAGNNPASSSPDFQGAVSTTSSFNLLGNNTGATGITNGVNNNQVGTGANPLDARLAPLGSNGGLTQTHSLLSGSPAIDKGGAASPRFAEIVFSAAFDGKESWNESFAGLAAALTTDQRGAARPFDNPTIPNAGGGNGSDIGAVELQVSPTAASVTIGGRVFAPDGRTISQARVTLTDASGAMRSAMTNAFGYYRFDEIQAGEIVIINVASKRYQFSAQVISLTEEQLELDFTAVQF